MALLRNRETGEWTVLCASHVFGRNPLRADTHLARPEVSLIHAAVRWRKGAWSIADHSRNGTFVDGQLLPKEHWHALEVGADLRFGSADAPAFEVVDLSPPSASLVPSDPTERPIQLERNSLLPDEHVPELSIYQTEEGHWMLDREDEVRCLKAGERIEVAGTAYSLVVNADLQDTEGVRHPTASKPVLRFTLSTDEEHATLAVHRGTEVVDLGERIHHYCLVTMARRRLRDAEQGLPGESQGWLFSDELARLLGIDVAHLNIQIYRARNQLMSAMPSTDQTANVVQRRRGSLRLGDIAFEIVRGTETEGRFEPTGRGGGPPGAPAFS